MAQQGSPSNQSGSVAPPFEVLCADLTEMAKVQLGAWGGQKFARQAREPAAIRPHAIEIACPHVFGPARLPARKASAQAENGKMEKPGARGTDKAGLTTRNDNDSDRSLHRR